MLHTHAQFLSSDTLDNETFDLFTGFIREKTGILLKENKRTLLANRLRKRTGELALKSFREYWRYLQETQNLEKELYHLFNAVTTNETYFQRAPHHYDIIYTILLPEFYQKHINKPDLHYNIWSSGVSSGEEAWDLAMVCEKFKKDHPRFNYTVIGTDLSEKVLDIARIGEYPDRKIAKLENWQVESFFDRVSPGESIYPFAKKVLKVKPVLQKNVFFKHHNLIRDSFISDIDLIVCRNVLIYFDTQTQEEIVEKFEKSLTKNGVLILGHSESLNLQPGKLKPERFDTGIVYKKTTR